MICVNDLTDLNCHKKVILEPLLILLAPFAPHFSEELWNLCGHPDSISEAHWPELNNSYLVEDTIEYPVSFNGKTRFKIELPANMDVLSIETAIMNHDLTQKQIQGAKPKKIVVVPKRIINIVY